MANSKGGAFFSGGAYVSVDTSDLQAKINMMRAFLTPEKFNQLIQRTFNEVGRRSRTLIAREVNRDYNVTQRWVRSQIGRYTVTDHGALGGVECTIPISGAKGVLGSEFAASKSGSSITASILRGSSSVLPATLPNQGGNPPFMYRGRVFTRRTKNKLPIVRVVGLGVPQMPLNRSEDHVSDALLDYADRRLDHNFRFKFGSMK